MERKLTNSLVGPDDLQLVELEVGRMIDLRREQAIHKLGKTPVLEISPALQDLLPSKARLPEVSELEDLKQWLIDTRTKGPVVYFALSALPGDKLTIELVEWFREQIHPQTMLVIEYNRGLAGGFALRLGGKIYDFSFRHALLANSGAMVKAMRNV